MKHLLCNRYKRFDISISKKYLELPDDIIYLYRYKLPLDISIYLKNIYFFSLFLDG